MLSDLYAVGLQEGGTVFTSFMVECIYQFYGWKLAIVRIRPPHPKVIHIVIPGICEHATLYAREELRLQMEVMLLIN